MSNAPKILSTGIKDGIFYQYDMALQLEEELGFSGSQSAKGPRR